MDIMQHEQPSNIDEKPADRVAADAEPRDDAKPQYTPKVTGRFCEPDMDVHSCEVLPGTPKVAEGRFDVAKLRVIHSKKLSADIVILLDDDAEAGVRPKANVAIYLSFDQAKTLSDYILATIMTSQ